MDILNKIKAALPILSLRIEQVKVDIEEKLTLIAGN